MFITWFCIEALSSLGATLWRLAAWVGGVWMISNQSLSLLMSQCAQQWIFIYSADSYELILLVCRLSCPCPCRSMSGLMFASVRVEFELFNEPTKYCNAVSSHLLVTADLAYYDLVCNCWAVPEYVGFCLTTACHQYCVWYTIEIYLIFGW